MLDGPSSNGHAALVTPAEVNQDLVGRTSSSGTLFRGALGVTGAMLVLGIIGLAMKLSDGTDVASKWGYYAAAFAFTLTTAQGAVIVAIAPRIAKAHWRRSISRIAELFAAVGLFNFLVFLPLLWVLPSLADGRRTLWFYDAADPDYSQVPQYAPHIWAVLSVGFLALVGVMLLWLSSVPDLAAERDRGGARFGGMAKHWYGTSRQWFIQYHRLGMLGAFYFMMLVSTHFLIAVDFNMSLIPGWIDALFPATQAANSLQAGCAIVIVAMYIARRWGGLEQYIGLDQFWGLGKLMFALSLLWFWFWFSSFIVLWYGARPNEQAILDLLIREPYWPAFVASFVLNFLTPLWVLMWNMVRKSILGPTLVAVGILVGTFFDRIRLYVAAYSVDGIGDPSVAKHTLAGAVPAFVPPDLSDVLVWMGVIGGSVFAYLIATRIFPVVNIWEQREVLLYRVHKPFHRTEVLVLGKPD